MLKRKEMHPIGCHHKSWGSLAIFSKLVKAITFKISEFKKQPKQSLLTPFLLCKTPTLLSF